MGFWLCKQCDGRGVVGRVFRKTTCPGCGGDGRLKPPGWPDEREIRRLIPKGPFPDAPPPSFNVRGPFGQYAPIPRAPGSSQ